MRAQSALFRRIDQCSVDYAAAEVLEVLRVWCAAHALDHADEDNVVGGVDPEPGTCGPVPEEGAFTLGQVCCWRVEDDGAVVSVTEAGAHTLRADAELAGEQMGREVVGAHEVDDGRREDAVSVELAVVGKHFSEAEVVFRGGDHASATGGQSGLAGEVAAVDVLIALRGEGAVGLDVVDRGEARPLVLRNVEACVFHAEGLEDFVAIELGKSFAGELFDDVALDVHGDGVNPLGAGLIEERELREFGDELVEVGGLKEVGVADHLVDGRVAEEAVGEAGGVGHELGHGGRVDGIFKDDFAGGVGAGVDLEVGELGDEFGDGVGWEPLALFVELHHGDGSDDLGHGVVAEDGGLGHGDFVLDVLPAVGAVVDDLAVAGEDGDDAGDLVVLDCVLHEGVEARDAVG